MQLEVFLLLPFCLLSRADGMFVSITSPFITRATCGMWEITKACSVKQCAVAVPYK